MMQENRKFEKRFCLNRSKIKIMSNSDTVDYENSATKSQTIVSSIHWETSTKVAAIDVESLSMVSFVSDARLTRSAQRRSRFSETNGWLSHTACRSKTPAAIVRIIPIACEGRQPSNLPMEFAGCKTRARERDT